MQKCSICHGDINAHYQGGVLVWSHGHNAHPINDGRCCDGCNLTVVIPARLSRAYIHNHPINKEKRRNENENR
mgnify:FL=1